VTRTLLEPPPVHEGAVDPDALIEEARRRARRRRALYGSAAVLVVAGTIAAAFSIGGGGSSAPRREAGGSRGRAPAWKIGETIPVAATDTVLFAARGRTLHEVTPSGVVRIGPGGTTRRRIRLPQSPYLMSLAAGPVGLYAGTAVIKRFTKAPDELVRIDPRTLTIRARATFSAAVTPVTNGAALWATLGDGRVVRLDPKTLALRATRRVGVVPASAAVGLGSLWVLAGSARRLELVQLDPSSLAVRSRAMLPSWATALVSDSGHVYLLGTRLAVVGADGTIRRASPVPGLAAARLHDGNLIGMSADATPALVLVSAGGKVLARTRLLDGSAQLAVTQHDAWFLGNAGQGDGIVHVHLR
jgi:hypothetical protein